jgi:NAD(P)-dependent dehydrogenase (short-subunit alcohol dehydrogenase family)
MWSGDENAKNTRCIIATYSKYKKMKTYLITGAGSGMGRATAALLSKQQDVQLILIGRNKKNLDETASQCSDSAQVLVHSMDIRDEKSWQYLKQNILTPGAKLHGVFANAGIGGENHYGPEDRWSEIISINLDGTYRTIMEMLPLLNADKTTYRHIVITSSCLARFGVPNYAAYCTAKTGLLGLTSSLALQFASDRILVNAICPGWVETEMAQTGIQKLADRNGQSYDKEFATQILAEGQKMVAEADSLEREILEIVAGKL